MAPNPPRATLADAVLVVPSAPVLRETLLPDELCEVEVPGTQSLPCCAGGSQSCWRHNGAVAAVTNPPPISTSRTCADRRMG